MNLDDAIKKVSNDLGIPEEVCHRAYMSAWKFIYTHAETPVLSINTPIEEFRQLRMNFNLPSLGKLYITEDKFNRTNKRFLYAQEIRNRKHAENQEH